ncbi:MAG: ankyrin repeat domain-containing protein [Ottowia sp.]|nr:ankyrin repeat domain-containing protein [Ottowia sp.]
MNRLMQWQRTVLCVLLTAAALTLAPAGVQAKAMDAEAFVTLCEEGTPEQVKAALQQGADVNASWIFPKHMDDTSPLTSAIWFGNLPVVRVLLAAGADVNAQSDSLGTTPLMVAAERGNSDAVHVLLQAGAKVNTKSVEGGETALMKAAASNSPEVLRALLAAGADKSLKDAQGHDALWHARQRADNGEIVRLLEGGAKKPAAATSATKYVGSIGPYPVTLFLDLRAGGEWVGRYFYDKRPQSVFRLKAVKNEAHLGGFHEVVLREYTARDHHTGTFTGRVVTRGEGFSGTFVNSKGQSFPFNLHEAQ